MPEDFYRLRFVGDYVDAVVVEKAIRRPCQTCGLGALEWPRPLTITTPFKEVAILGDITPVHVAWQSVVITDRVRVALQTFAGFETLELSPTKFVQPKRGKSTCIMPPSTTTPLWYCEPGVIATQVVPERLIVICPRCKRPGLKIEARRDPIMIRQVKDATMFRVEHAGGVYIKESLREYLLMKQFTNFATRKCGSILGSEEEGRVLADWHLPGNQTV